MRVVHHPGEMAEEPDFRPFPDMVRADYVFISAFPGAEPPKLY